MEFSSIGKALAIAASVTAAAALTACGSDKNAAAPSSSTGATGGSSAAADCGGKDSLTAEGSTAQQNAIAVFNQVWGQ